MDGSSRHSPRLCGDYRRSFVRSVILLALVVAALISQLALLTHHDCLSSPARSFRVPLPIQAATAAISQSSRLPPSYRVAPKHECIASRSLDFAPASYETRISLDDQRQFALGGYNLIAKGSGDFRACGPIISLLSRIQHSQGIYGTLAEFGVHHGRFTGFLFTTARMTEKLIVGDVFMQQEKNVDKSGLGDKKMFMRGLMTYGLHPSAMHAVIEASTDELPFDFSRKALSEPFRIVSVDASHTAAFTFNDLQLAFCNLLRGGIVILDDWFHNAWPGVVEGFYQFVEHGSMPEVYPILICESKLFLTNDKALYQLYYDTLRNAPEFQSFVTPYAHEKDRGKLEYEMMGIKYLKCSSRSNMTTESIQQLWANLAY